MSHISQRWLKLLTLLTLALFITGLYMAFLYAQTETRMGLVYRIFFFHLGAIISSTVAVLVVAVAGVAFLRTNARGWDRIGEASAEIGVLFGTIGLISGSIWARATWGAWWTWDPRLTTFLVLWFIYVAYLMLRASARDDPRVARFCAVFGLVGAIDVPIVFMSARIWRGISPVLGQAGSDSTFGLTPEMSQTLMVAIVAYLFLYAYLLILRVRLEELRDELVALRRALAK